MDIIWRNFHSNLQESLSLQSWQAEDLPNHPKENHIWQNSQFTISTIPKVNKKNPLESLSWLPPPPGIFKLNFDGASKGNLGRAGYGGIFRTSLGQVHLIFFGCLGWDTNNSVELEGLWQGFNLIHLYNFSPTIVEGDSQILISMANQLL